MRLSRLSTVIAVTIFVLLAAGLMAGIGFGTLSGFGLDEIYALCPLGAIEAMIAEHTVIPRAMITIIVMALLVLLLGRFFCAFICPVSFLKKLRDFFSPPDVRKKRRDRLTEEVQEVSRFELDIARDGAGHGGCASCLRKQGRGQERKQGGKQERKRPKLDSRHALLGGTLVSTAIFGFPVFCLVCPIGLSFATVLLLWRAFAFGDPTIGMVIVPAMLMIEVVFLRKWCGRFCPLSALMNLVSRFSKTWVPTIDDNKCIETTTGKPCGMCAIVCDADINLRHPDYGEHSLADCTRCHDCVASCPTNAISVPFLPRRDTDEEGTVTSCRD
jgi:ferredoxin-type protein NapH